jgi:hypothetical protein
MTATPVPFGSSTAFITCPSNLQTTTRQVVEFPAVITDWKRLRISSGVIPTSDIHARFREKIPRAILGERAENLSEVVPQEESTENVVRPFQVRIIKEVKAFSPTETSRIFDLPFSDTEQYVTVIGPPAHSLSVHPDELVFFTRCTSFLNVPVHCDTGLNLEHGHPK